MSDQTSAMSSIAERPHPRTSESPSMPASMNTSIRELRGSARVCSTWGRLPIDDADDTKSALKELKEQLAHYIHVSGKAIRDLEAQINRLTEKASIPVDVAIKRSKS